MTAVNTVRKTVESLRLIAENLDLLLLLTLALLAVGTHLFIEIADEVHEGDAQKYDQWILRRLRETGQPKNPIGPPWFESIWRDFTALGSPAVLALITAVAALYLLLTRHLRTLSLLLIAIIGGVIFCLLMKSFFDRPRPEFMTNLDHVYTKSFPSGHSMLATVVYLTLGVLLASTTAHIRLRIFYLAVPAFLALLVGLSRIYLGLHYPTDVLAGWTAGFTWALLCWTTAYILQKTGKIEAPI